MAKDLVPLLAEETPITYDYRWPDEWRICDRAADTIASLLHWPHSSDFRYTPLEKREELLTKAREWAKTTVEQ